tara:strand:+ start:8909 stop:10654 length:1746 start_codon:yes stop_codon:yes gene_type:complete
MNRINRSDLLGSTPVFLLEIQWNGRTFHFSTFPIDILKDNGESIHFSGGLADPELKESISDLNRSPQANTLSLELIFPINLVQEFFEFGRLLDIATGELSLVTEREGSIVQTYEKRMRIFSGRVIQPIIGDPDQPSGYCALTIERNANNEPQTIIKPDGIFRGNGSYISPSDLTGFSNGKAYPIVFGNPNEYVPFISSAAGPLEKYQSYPTPAFLIWREQPATPTNNYDDLFRLCIAGHSVEATTCLIRDYKGNIKDNVPILEATTRQGKVISYVELRFWFLATLIDGIVNPWMEGASGSYGDAKTDNPEYFVSWTNGGGMKNPYGEGYLEGAGDIILYFLNLTNIEIDNQAWANVSGFLNGYKFGGYVDDPEATAYKFLQDNIFPFVPVHATNSAKGLRPVIPLLYYSQYPQPVLEMDLGTGFYLNSAIEYSSEPDDIENRIMMNYAFCLFRKNNPAGLLVDGNLDDHTAQRTNTELAQLSYHRYGDRYKEIIVSYVYEFETAMKILMYRLRRRALPKMRIEIQADPVYGWIQLGDVISITSTELYMGNFRGMIMEKSYSEGAWVFIVELENSVILQERK